jgi:hypothetical protein
LYQELLVTVTAARAAQVPAKSQAQPAKGTVQQSKDGKPPLAAKHHKHTGAQAAPMVLNLDSILDSTPEVSDMHQSCAQKFIYRLCIFGKCDHWHLPCCHMQVIEMELARMSLDELTRLGKLVNVSLMEPKDARPLATDPQRVRCN